MTTFDGEDGCVPGMHSVTVVAAETPSPSTIRWLAPIKYRDAATSGLTVTIDQPTENLQINLTWDGGEPFVETTETSADADPTKQ